MHLNIGRTPPAAILAMLASLSSRLAATTSALLLGLPLNATARNSTPPPVTAKPSFAEPGLSPDGRTIAFVSAGDIWTVPSTGGPARLLVSHQADESRPLYSPDGSRLAFVSTRTGNGDVYVLTLATGALERVTFDDMPEQVDAWSRDGKWLYFSSTRDDISGMADEYRVHADGGTAMPVAADRYASEYWGAPSPDGSTLAITARGVSRTQWWRRGSSHLDQSEIDLVRDASNGTPTYTTLVGMGARSGWPMWSADGGTIYFVSDRAGSNGSGTENLWSQPVAGGAPTQLTHFTNGRVLWPSISSDGRSVAFERDFGIWRYDVASRQAAPVSITLEGSPAAPAPEHVTLTHDVDQLALSPDGKKVAFITHGEVFAASAKDGGNAMRVTDTPAQEDEVDWAPDSRRIVYTSDRDGAWHIYMYDFGTSRETRLTNGDANDASPQWAPDGKTIVFTRGGRELRAIDPVTHADRELASATFWQQPFGGGDVAFSPDGRWVAYLSAGGVHGFQNASVVPLAGGESHPVSFLANSFASTIAWGRDGTYLLYSSSQRTEPRQLARIDLVPRTPHFREDQFRDLFREQQPPSQRPATQPQRPARTTTDSTNAPARSPLAADSNNSNRESAPAAKKPVSIAFDGIRERLSLLPVDVDVFDIQISPDGNTALLTASSDNHVNLYTYPLDDLAREPAVAKQLTSTPGRKSNAQWSPDGKEVYYVEDGRINTVNVDSRVTKPLAVSADMDVDFAHEKTVVFAQAWSYLRDNFFSPTMNGVDWNAVHSEYASRIAGAQSQGEMRRILSLMVGELNSSHSGIGGPPAQRPYTGRVGLRFDRAEYERNGRFRITDVVPLSPAAVAGVRAGEYLTSIDGTPLSAHTSYQELLANRIGRRTVLGVAPSVTGAARDVAVLPVSSGTEKGLVYRAWVERNRAYVAKASGGKLGYVHMFDMSSDALRDLYLDLDAENMSKEGVVIDVRNNNGGFVNAYALDVLSRQPYLVMQPRGRTAVSARSQLGQRALERPTALVVNQHTLSDGEDFTEGYEAMHLGPVVGEPTAGWIVFTSNFTLIDSTTVRIPFARITDTEGRDMEMHPRPVDVEVQRPIGSSYRDVDPQLDAAVKALLQKVSTQRTALH